MNTRRTPFDEMNRFFDQFRGDTFDWPTVRGGQETDLNLTMERTEDAYVVLADLPGFEREEIDLTFEEGTVEISATHEVDEDSHYRSRAVFDRITVPDDIDVEALTATYQNGVLEITLPTRAELTESGHRIDIE
ncbi:Hsp20/alpha crystallin family protein [Halapricum salinum]|nr:Hsp20/alpha crystallin family protein [Halapricum salinum]